MHPAPAPRDFRRVALVVLGLPSVERLHIQGVSKEKRQACPGAEIGEPVPGADAFDGKNDLGPLGCNSLQPCLRAGGHLAMPHELTVLAQHTDVHGAGMQVAAAVDWVVLGVKAHAVSSA
jgi:hypothetical protein